MAKWKSRFGSLVLAVLIFSAGCAAIEAQGAEHAPDFRAQERIAPLTIPPKPNAPFMAIAKTLWVRTLPDGSTVTSQNERVVARDMDGRIFQERRTFIPVPDDGKQQSQVFETDLTDPVNHTVYRCEAQRKECNLFNYYGPVSVPEAPAGLQPGRTTFLTRENLGLGTFAGLDVELSRETYTHYVETIGNTRTVLRTIEYWYSSALGVNVQVKRHDPRDGDQTLWLTDVTLSSPPPETFQVPAGFRIVDHRNTAPAQVTGYEPR